MIPFGHPWIFQVSFFSLDALHAACLQRYSVFLFKNKKHERLSNCRRNHHTDMFFFIFRELSEVYLVASLSNTQHYLATLPI